MTDYWRLMMIEKYGSDEAVNEEMARRGRNSAGKPKKYNKLRDEEGYAKALRGRANAKNGQKSD